MTHTITITKLQNDDGDNEVEYTLGGDCNGDPAVYLECEHEECKSAEPEFWSYQSDVVRHGLNHIWSEGYWCVESDQCPLRYIDNIDYACQEFGKLGTFPLEIEWDESWSATPYEDEPTA